MIVKVKKIGQFVRMIEIDGEPVVAISAVREKPGTSPIYEIQPTPESRVILENTMLKTQKRRGEDFTVFERPQP